MDRPVTEDGPDYETLIDDETWAFIHRTNAFYAPETATLPIDQQRAVYDRMCREFHAGIPKGVTVRDETAGGVPVRIYESGPAQATVLYFHGGGFVVGGLESHDDICAEICHMTALRVVAVDYRLCPEHRHPAQIEDCRTALNWTIERWPENVVLVGDSAGANLAAALAHDARGRTGRIAGQVLIYGAFGESEARESMRFHADAPLLSAADIAFYHSVRCDGEPPVGDPTLAPLADTDFADLPPSVVIAAECDPLCDDSRAYHERLTASGNKSVLFIEPGLVHGFLRARGTAQNARISFERIVAGITALAYGVWSYDE